jgi:hypothetical protein
VVQQKLYAGKEELLVPRMLLNRHYEAEGIQKFDQETWRLFVYGEAVSPEFVPNTGRGFARKFLADILRYIRSLLPERGEAHEGHCEDHHHGSHVTDDPASGAAMLVLHEMIMKVLDGGGEVFTVQLCRVAMEMLVERLAASAWSVRSVTLQVLSDVLKEAVDLYPTVVQSFMEDLVKQLKSNVTHQIPGIRKDAVLVVAQVVDVLNRAQVWRDFALELIHAAVVDSAAAEEPNVNRPMFSCCSLGGASRKSGSPTERGDGGARLLAALGLREGSDHGLLLRLSQIRPELTKTVDLCLQQLQSAA